jgi:hypothetical protein
VEWTNSIVSLLGGDQLALVPEEQYNFIINRRNAQFVEPDVAEALSSASTSSGSSSSDESDDSEAQGIASGAE